MPHILTTTTVATDTIPVLTIAVSSLLSSSSTTKDSITSGISITSSLPYATQTGSVNAATATPQSTGPATSSTIAIVGIAVGGAVALLISIVAVWFIVRVRRKRNSLVSNSKPQRGLHGGNYEKAELPTHSEIREIGSGTLRGNELEGYENERRELEGAELVGQELEGAVPVRRELEAVAPMTEMP
ncbi:hypothetical protein MMC13_000609 [Lambiella insularis]|nr:hypothetical protein [Lambiella insularis]